MELCGCNGCLLRQSSRQTDWLNPQKNHQRSFATYQDSGNDREGFKSWRFGCSDTLKIQNTLWLFITTQTIIIWQQDWSVKAGSIAHEFLIRRNQEVHERITLPGSQKTWAQRVLNASSDCSGLTSLICLYACLSALYVTLWLSKPLIDLNSKNLMFRLFRHIGAALFPFSPEAKILWITSSCYRSQNHPEQHAGSCLTSDLWPVIDSHTEAWFTQATIDLIFGRKGPVWIQLFPKCVFFHIKCFNSWMF